MKATSTAIGQQERANLDIALKSTHASASGLGGEMGWGLVPTSVGKDEGHIKEQSPSRGVNCSGTGSTSGSPQKEGNATQAFSCSKHPSCTVCKCLRRVQRNRSGFAVREITEFEISDSQGAFIMDTAKNLTRGHHMIPDRDAHSMTRIGTSALGRVLLPEQVRILHLFGSGRIDALRITGLPQVSNDVCTFSGYREDPDEVLPQDCIHLGLLDIARLSPISFRFENKGRIFRNVAPTRASMAQASSHGATIDLDYHTDNYLGDFENTSGLANTIGVTPSVLSFYGMRNADAHGKPVPTKLIPVNRILSLLAPEDIQNMKSPIFTLLPAASNNLSPRKHTPLMVEDDEGRLYFRFNAAPGQVLGETSAAETTVKKVLDAILEIRGQNRWLNLQINPGVWAAFQNTAVLHARESFDPGQDPQHWRWLRRVFSVRDPNKGFFHNPLNEPFVVS